MQNGHKSTLMYTNNENAHTGKTRKLVLLKWHTHKVHGHRKKKYYGQENSYHTVEKKQKHLNELDMAAY